MAKCLVFIPRNSLPNMSSQPKQPLSFGSGKHFWVFLLKRSKTNLLIFKSIFLTVNTIPRQRAFLFHWLCQAYVLNIFVNPRSVFDTHRYCWALRHFHSTASASFQEVPAWRDDAFYHADILSLHCHLFHNNPEKSQLKIASGEKWRFLMDWPLFRQDTVED